MTEHHQPSTSFPCDLCGEAGTLRGYPGPVPVTGAWCDACYRVQAMMAPQRTMGLWWYHSATHQDGLLPIDDRLADHYRDQLRPLLHHPKSAIVLHCPDQRGIDCFVHPKQGIIVQYGNWQTAWFAAGEVDQAQADTLLTYVLAGGDLKTYLQEQPLANFEIVDMGNDETMD